MLDNLFPDLFELLVASEADLPEGPHEGSYHSQDKCEGGWCPFHNPSQHKMNTWPRNIRSSGLVERSCDHGVGHPDPDSVTWLNGFTRRSGWGIHGCDGCCWSS